MRLYVPGAGGAGRPGWPNQPGEGAVFADFEAGSPFDEKTEAILSVAPRGAITLVAHSAGAIPATLIVGRRLLEVSRFVLVEPALYDIARGHPSIEHHIETLTRARQLFAAGDRRGYWAVIGPLMFNSLARAEDWTEEQPRAERLHSLGVPWGSEVAASMIEGVPTLVVTGGWNDEYEAIADVLVEHGARHELLVGNRHRPQDHSGFEELVADFESDDTDVTR